jgi:hypothetical protein
MLKRLAVVVVYLSLTVTANAGQQKTPAADHERDANQLPPIVSNQTNNPVASQQGSKAEDKPQGWHKLVAWPDGITTWAILFTLGAIIWQSSETRRAASAAHLQSQIATDTAKRQLRAYLCIDEACVKITPKAGEPTRLEAQLHIKNGGQTPAYGVKSWLFAHIGSYPENTPAPPPPEGIPRGIAIIPAQGKNIFTAKEIAIFPPIMEDLDTPTVPAAYYVQGEVCYRDIFKDWHCLKIRMLYGGPAKTRKTQDSKGVTMGFLGPDAWGNSEEDIPKPEDEQKPN